MYASTLTASTFNLSFIGIPTSIGLSTLTASSIGINIQAPTSALDIRNGSINVSSSAGFSITATGDISCRSLYLTSSLNAINVNTSTITVSTLLTTSTANTQNVNFVTIVSSASGKILLGTGTPTYRFEINGGSVLTSFTTGWRYGVAGAGSNSPGPINDVISMKTDAGIWATIFFATSDQRIKKNVQRLEEEKALEVVRQIKPVTYQYIDQINRHNQIEYGFIAQDVKPVLPYAVRSESDFIPNIYDLADITSTNESTSIVTLRTKHTEDLEKGDTLKIVDLREKSIIVKILHTSNHSITVDTNLLVRISEYSPTEEDRKNNIQPHTVFVYGKKVDDVHILEKNAIFSVGMAAIKEMDRLVVEQGNRIIDQGNRIAELQNKYTLLQEELRSRS